MSSHETPSIVEILSYNSDSCDGVENVVNDNGDVVPHDVYDRAMQQDAQLSLGVTAAEAVARSLDDEVDRWVAEHARRTELSRQERYDLALAYEEIAGLDKKIRAYQRNTNGRQELNRQRSLLVSAQSQKIADMLGVKNDVKAKDYLLVIRWRRYIAEHHKDIIGGRSDHVSENNRLWDDYDWAERASGAYLEPDN